MKLHLPCSNEVKIRFELHKRYFQEKKFLLRLKKLTKKNKFKITNSKLSTYNFFAEKSIKLSI
jgi:hypothetical protein